jgi:16S rRNA (guanine(966)-N(2))-methyltransferase RsmD
MRITGGKYKGRTIETVKGQEVRPTSSKVRESIFNIIQLSENSTVFYEGKTVMLDLFAGSGIMGLESLSRGAESVVFVEKNPKHANIIKNNLKNLGIDSKLIIADATKIIDKLDEKFNFIFIDPPYHAGFYEPVLAKIQAKQLLAEDGFIILEHPVTLDIKAILSKTDFQVFKEKVYGDTGITIII